MNAPNPIFVRKAGIKNTIDFAILWHLALCGLTGANMWDLVEAVSAGDNTVRTSLARLDGMKLVVCVPNRDLVGHPQTWVCSRLGYRIMTGHLQPAEKVAPGGQLPLGAMIEQHA